MLTNESELAEFIIKNPWVINDDLEFIGKEASTHSDEDGRIDLLFKDKFSRYWIIELKKGLITSSAVSQLVKYVGALAQKYNLGREMFNLVLIGKNASSEVKSFCSLFGIRLTELGLVDELDTRIKIYIKNLEKQNEDLKRPKIVRVFKGRIEPKPIPKIEYKTIKLYDVQSAASDNFLEITNELLLPGIFTEKRIELINEILRSKPSSIRDLASALHRDTKNVFDDLRLLQEAKIIDILVNGKRRVPTLRKKTIIIKLGNNA
jgi:translation initiation factor 2 beta subunit (eIF-2beta)/eIF-5